MGLSESRGAMQMCSSGGGVRVMEEDPRCARLMVQRREQLMEDIETIVEGNFNECAHWHKQMVVRMLCDAVVRNFPSGTKV